MKRTTRAPGLSHAQLELMNIVWAKGESSVTEIWTALRERRALARTTVMTVLARLAEKGWLKRRMEKNEVIYRAAVPKDQALRGIVSRLLDSAFDGSLAGMVTTLVEGRGVSAVEARHLRRIIDGSATRPS